MTIVIVNLGILHHAHFVCVAQPHTLKHPEAHHFFSSSSSAMTRGRKWRSEPIPLASYMRRRDIPRTARDAERRLAAERAVFAWFAVTPSPALLLMMAHLGQTQSGFMFAMYLRSRSFLALCLAHYFNSTILRPLNAFPDGHELVPFHLWPTSAEFAREFRISTFEDLQHLFQLLEIPNVVRSPDAHDASYACRGIDALAVSLARLSYPGRLNDLIRRLRLNWSASKLSQLFNTCVRFLQDRWNDIVKFDSRVFLDGALLRTFADAIHAKGFPLRDCCGFIDGTTIGIARPGGQENQRAFYNGHKRQHIVRWQGVVTPDGMIVSFFGPHEGASNDRGLLNYSQLVSTLEQFLQRPALGFDFYLYGDSAYDNVQSMALFGPADLPNQAAQTAASAIRVSEEHVYGREKSK
jgi:hypothetical protein